VCVAFHTHTILRLFGPFYKADEAIVWHEKIRKMPHTFKVMPDKSRLRMVVVSQFVDTHHDRLGWKANTKKNKNP
jgi:hypothetical protein